MNKLKDMTAYNSLMALFTKQAVIFRRATAGCIGGKHHLPTHYAGFHHSNPQPTKL